MHELQNIKSMIEIATPSPFLQKKKENQFTCVLLATKRIIFNQ
ncbi:hypothetical protein pb186bvf_003154 [Paramecium bursaria]